jgi:hypothetical protein
MTRINEKWRKERKVLSHLFSEIALKRIGKENNKKMSP